MKILYVATVLSHICQFHLPYLEMLQKKGHVVHVAARDNLAEKNGLQLKGCDKFIPVPFERSPLSPKNLQAARILRKQLKAEHYDIILCNTPMGGIVTRFVAGKTRKAGTRVLYMAHGFHFYKGASKKNWLVYYPIEKLMARRCDAVITINDEDYALAKEKFSGTVEHIHGVGVRSDRYYPVPSEMAAGLRTAEGLSSNDFVILCVGELNANKDQGTLLKAAASLWLDIPNMKILLAGNGPMDAMLKEEARRLQLQDAVSFLGYRTDLERITPAVDLVVSCSHREGMPLNIIEAMLCARPVVASRNRGHNELVEDGVTGLLFDAGNSAALAERILSLYHNRVRAAAMGESASRKAQNYTVEAVKDEMMKVLGV